MSSADLLAAHRRLEQLAEAVMAGAALDEKKEEEKKENTEEEEEEEEEEGGDQWFLNEMAAQDAEEKRRRDAAVIEAVAGYRDADLAPKIRAVLVNQTEPQSPSTRARLLHMGAVLESAGRYGQRDVERAVAPPLESGLRLFKTDHVPVWGRGLPPYSVSGPAVMAATFAADDRETVRTLYVMAADMGVGERVDALGSMRVGDLIEGALYDPARAEYAPDWVTPATRVDELVTGEYDLRPSGKVVHVGELRTLAAAIDWKQYPVRAPVEFHEK